MQEKEKKRMQQYAERDEKRREKKNWSWESNLRGNKKMILNRRKWKLTLKSSFPSKSKLQLRNTSLENQDISDFPDPDWSIIKISDLYLGSKCNCPWFNLSSNGFCSATSGRDGCGWNSQVWSNFILVILPFYFLVGS